MPSLNSRLNNYISYSKKSSIYKNDKNKEATVYKIKLTEKEIPVVIALGEIRNDFIKYNIVYCPVYLVLGDGKKNKITFKPIGVYEFFKSAEDNLKDKEGDLDIRLIEGPLLYNDINSKKITKLLNDKPILKDITEEEQELNQKKENEISIKSQEEAAIKAKPLLISLEIEDDDDSEYKNVHDEKEYRKIVKDYEAMGVNAPRKNWLQKKMHDYNYTMINNKGGGDCFFIALSQAYKSIGKKTNQNNIRERLARSIPESVFVEYKSRENMFRGELDRNMKKQKEMGLKTKELVKMKEDKKKAFDEIKKTLPQTRISKDPRYKEIAKIQMEIKNIFGKFQKLRDDMKNTKELLEEFNFMKGINTLKEFREKIKSNDFWADESTIRILEELLNIKIIVIDKENRNGLIHCTDASETIKAKGFFKPKYYVIMDLFKKHYQLVSYKNRKMFRFHELPHAIKEQIKHSCLVGSGNNIYNYIPKFNKLIKVNDDDGKDDDDDEETTATIEDSKAEEEDNTEFKDYDENTHFVFYSKSSNKKPGKGKHEKIPKEKEGDYSELSKIKDWRRVLSNFYVVVKPFELDGHTWNSVEHYYQASKFKNYTEGSDKHNFYLKFTAESNSEISKDPDKAKKYGGKNKTGKYRPKHILMDEDFFTGKHKKFMEEGQRAKYTQDEHSQKVLLLTKNAKLLHLMKIRGAPSELIPFFDSMKIRKELSNK